MYGKEWVKTLEGDRVGQPQQSN